MARPDWEVVREVVADALALPAGERPAFLVRSCCHDPEVRSEVESLLALEARAEGFLDRPPLPWPSAGVAAPLPAGERLGAYEVEGVLGRGGMGVVYLARRADQAFDKEVAVKVLHRAPLGEEDRRRFRIERQILADLDHPGIARLLDAGELADGRPYLVMERVEGEPIHRHCERRGLALRERVALLVRVCRVVHAAHQNLVIHRDLKPSNILVTAAGEPKLLDFGIAKLLAPGRAHAPATATRFPWMPLTPEYASPELLLGEPVSTATDVYSLGVVLFELLAGRRPFEAEEASPLRLIRALAESAPPRLSEAAPPAARRPLQGDLDWIAARALAREGPERYESAAALAADFERYLAGEPVAAASRGALFRLAAFAHRHRRVAALGLAAAVGLMAVLGGWMISQQRERLRAAEIAALVREVEGMESYGQMAALYPFHQERLDRHRLSEAMERIRARLPELSGEIRAVSYWALARGEVTIRRLEEALLLTDQALATGYEVPGVQGTRAYATIRLYFQAVSLAALAATPEETSDQIAAAERRWGATAHQLFLESRGTTVVPPTLIEAWIALKEGRFDDAQAWIAQAVTARPLLHEFRGLEGEIEVQRGLDAARRGDHRRAVEALAAAGPLLEVALAIGRSSAGLYEAECNRRLQLAALADRHPDLLPALPPGWAEEPCRRALTIQPDEPFVHQLLAVSTNRLRRTVLQRAAH